MATKARIGIITKNKVAKTIGIAYEGYPEYTGELLTKFFRTPTKVRKLIAKGDIIQLEDSLEAIEQDELLGQAKEHRLYGNLLDLASECLVDFSYFFLEESKTWVMVADNNLVNL